MRLRNFFGLVVVVAWTMLSTSCTSFMSPRVDATRHIAKDGDTLDKIAATYYGSSEKVSILLQANPKLDPSQPLAAGQLVHIPSTP